MHYLFCMTTTAQIAFDLAITRACIARQDAAWLEMSARDTGEASEVVCARDAWVDSVCALLDAFTAEVL